MAGTALRLSLASGGGGPNHNQDMWQELRLLAAMAGGAGPARAAAQALAMATRGGAAALGMEAELGTLEAGKWADICCVDLGGPATHPVGDPVTQLVFGGGRDMVSDVWVAGRILLSEGTLTRLDWPNVAARADAWAARMNSGG
jgi:5-methylthioadenosine/S-adenosylhomocysteine deaminase